MLPDEANAQKQKKREEQLKKWRERELSDPTITNLNKLEANKSTRVRFPKSCVFLASCASGDIEEVKQHLKYGVNINTVNIDGLTALHQACIDANIDMVKFLVENSADINAQDNEGWTPLHASVSVGNLEVSKYLINKGAKLNICNNDSDLPIDLCDSTNIPMKNFLEEEMRIQNIDPDFEKQKEEIIMYEDAKEMNFRDKIHQKTGATPLHVSAAKGYIKVMKLLLEHGANVNALDNDGWTPLHAAAHWEQEEACRILAENGASFDIKNYSGQTPLDVCDNDMINKLKSIQLTYKQNPFSNNNNNISNDFKSDSRIRRSSDESNKSSILRLTNEAKSSISEREKKQEKILLSPISTNTKPTFDYYNNSETETDKKFNDQSSSTIKLTTLTPIDEIKSSSTYSNGATTAQILPPTTSSVSSLATNQAFSNNNNNNKSVEFRARFTNSQEDTNPTNEKLSRWNISSVESTPNHNRFNSSSNENNVSNTSEDDSFKLNDASSANDSASRRYSSAPVASKDEQAELIRKQKAKLERHFRRSTQAVSYEDIKSAEATIKGNSNNNSSNPMSPVSPLTPNSGVSSLSSIFGESVNKNVTINSVSNNPTSLKYSQQNAQPSLTVTITNPSSTILSNAPSTLTSSATSSPSNQYFTTQSITANTQPQISNNSMPTLVTTTGNESIEKDTIIANDIETDKLLNVIEKSKGFSDTYSTTAARRLRNRANPYSLTSLSLNSSNNSLDESSSQPSSATAGLTNNKKINNLIWNEERLEVEYRDKNNLDNNQENSSSSSPSSKSSSIFTFDKDNNNLAINSPPTNLNNQPTSNNTHTSRHTSRFGTNDLNNPNNSNNYLNNISNGTSSATTNISDFNSLGRTNIKRSVSQVPSIERKPLTQTNSLNPTTLTSTTTLSSVGSNDNKNYQSAYENLKKENEQLNLTIVNLKKELEEQSKKSTPTSSSITNDGTLDKKEKRAFDRRISELEEEIKKMESLKQDNTRLKEENAALIRVISKLSK